MPFNVLLLPLLGGYVFVSNWSITRYTTKRYSGQRLIFHAAIAGVFFLTIAFTTTHLLTAVYPDLHDRWRDLVPFEYSGTSFLAFLLGAGLWLPLNHLHDETELARKAVEESNAYLELLFWDSVNLTRQISITISTGKVYIGFVTSYALTIIKDPRLEDNYVVLLPTMSGYRRRADQKMIITNDYSQAYARLIDTNPDFLMSIADEMQLVIPESQIVSANFFDPEVYEHFAARAADSKRVETD